jgi:hypothetical protein
MFVLTISSLWKHKTCGMVTFDQDSIPALKIYSSDTKKIKNCNSEIN